MKQLGQLQRVRTRQKVFDLKPAIQPDCPVLLARLSRLTLIVGGKRPPAPIVRGGRAFAGTSGARPVGSYLLFSAGISVGKSIGLGKGGVDGITGFSHLPAFSVVKSD